MGGAVSFTVPGRPRPQGSKRAFVNKHTGRAQMVEQSPHIQDWRARVAHEAAEACEEPFRDVPVSVKLRCFFDRPKAHYRTGKNSHLLKDSAPVAPITRSTGDADKLARAVLDALTPSVIVDDSLVCGLMVVCAYGEPRLEVEVWESATRDAGPAVREMAA